MDTLTYEFVEQFIENNFLKYYPGQKEISYPVIARIHRRLQEGHNFSAIKVVDDVIDDGHHRFICLSLLQRDVETIPAGRNLGNGESFEWKNVKLSKQDYDTEAQRNEYIQRYDENTF